MVIASHSEMDSASTRLHPSISVIVPAYNAAAFIARTVQSLTIQSLPFWEIIIVDDGSTDDTQEVVRKFAASEPSNIVLHSQLNAGVSAARNAGLSLASGDYVFFLDADDIVSPLLVERVSHSLTHTADPIDVVYWSFETVSGARASFPDPEPQSSSRTPIISSGLDTLADALARRIKLWTGSVMFRTDMLRRTGLRYTVGCRMGEDSEFIWSALLLAERVLRLDSRLSWYLRREGSLTTRPPDLHWFDSVLADERFAAAAIRSGRPLPASVVRLLTIRVVQRHLATVAAVVRAGMSPSELTRQLQGMYPRLTADVRSHIIQRLRRGELVPVGWLLFVMTPRGYAAVWQMYWSWAAIKRCQWPSVSARGRS